MGKTPKLNLDRITKEHRRALDRFKSATDETRRADLAEEAANERARAARARSDKADAEFTDAVDKYARTGKDPHPERTKALQRAAQQAGDAADQADAAAGKATKDAAQAWKKWNDAEKVLRDAQQRDPEHQRYLKELKEQEDRELFERRTQVDPEEGADETRVAMTASSDLDGELGVEANVASDVESLIGDEGDGAGPDVRWPDEELVAATEVNPPPKRESADGGAGWSDDDVAALDSPAVTPEMDDSTVVGPGVEDWLEPEPLPDQQVAFSDVPPQQGEAEALSDDGHGTVS
jgi:hypothetical protein